MLHTLKKYWIALLVLVLVGLHGAIVAMVRLEAINAKQNASCEYDLGNFRLATNHPVGPMSFQLHSLAPVNHRIQSGKLLELNQVQVRQALEEHLRQVSPELLLDPLLVELKHQLLDTMIQTVGSGSVEEILITQLQPIDERSEWAFGAPSAARAGRIVITRRAEHEQVTAEAHTQIEAAKAAEHGDTHGGGHGNAHGSGHGDAHGDAHGGGHGDKSGGGHDDPHADQHADPHAPAPSHGGH